jgi:hypothetical protein
MCSLAVIGSLLASDELVTRVSPQCIKGRRTSANEQAAAVDTPQAEQGRMATHWPIEW